MKLTPLLTNLGINPNLRKMNRFANDCVGSSGSSRVGDNVDPYKFADIDPTIAMAKEYAKLHRPSNVPSIPIHLGKYSCRGYNIIPQ